jgi:hypothetical protein
VAKFLPDGGLGTNVWGVEVEVGSGGTTVGDGVTGISVGVGVGVGTGTVEVYVGRGEGGTVGSDIFASVGAGGDMSAGGVVGSAEEFRSRSAEDLGAGDIRAGVALVWAAGTGAGWDAQPATSSRFRNNAATT